MQSGLQDDHCKLTFHAVLLHFMMYHSQSAMGPALPSVLRNSEVENRPFLSCSITLHRQTLCKNAQIKDRTFLGVADDPEGDAAAMMLPATNYSQLKVTQIPTRPKIPKPAQHYNQVSG